ncbi:capon-like protein isoform X4 [Phlebotomus papatasi]|uniref:capon-like protein isoform X4 n=1 Tax=Phlebotomus papatasi TaxID=29031 RepID=UPI0024837179|nr:capon-like protein isoform X4 [Phlebotomus papatasi]XP_055703271.1 capon-like protein isoform X4 [Phlebotomus papatasi]XP_055703273.1 capon-like protein isoform X4 [Phlebotomus papatasi]XP_055703274.1 capon-like protein isoform X4 [Phlebotomus papatasi]
MPSTPYDLVSDDLDVRVPLYADQAFDHGITFQAKFIGWQEVPRPSSKTEIVQAMRRIRYECKVQNMKKRKVSIEVSVDGVRVCLKKKKRKKKQWNGDGNGLELMNHPIYRIFYVSHDSSDLKIFSYIARDGSTDTFKCSVFKSHKKSQAMRIVRTVGQAFEVCHNRKVSAQNTKVTALDRAEDGGSETPCDTSEQDRCSDPLSDDEEPRKEIIPITPEPVLARPNHLDILSQVNYDSRKSPQENEERSTSPLPAAREIQKLKEQLEQQSLQTRQALAQLMLVREQLISETNARVEAQARTQQLLQQNRELLEHIAALGGYHEPDRPSLTAATLGIAPQSPLFLTPTSDGNDLGSPVRKTFAPPNAATLSQLGTINQQLTTLSQQLSGLNQQQQNLHNLQQLTFGANPLPTSFGPPRSTPSSSGELISQQELFQLNAELLSRLQNLNFGQNGTQNGVNNNSPQSSYIFCNSSALSGNNNANLLNSPSSGSNLTPSPLGTLNRSSFSASPLDESLAVSLERNLDASDHETHLIKPLSQVGTLTTLDSEGKVKVLVPISAASSSSKAAVGRKTEKKVTLPEMVTLKVTDESGNVTKKLPATPSFITRSTSEKVPSRSQMMVQVQRTQWARHTTK